MPQRCFQTGDTAAKFRPTPLHFAQFVVNLCQRQIGIRQLSSGASGSTEKEAKLGTPSLTPGLFDRVEESEQDTTDEDNSSLARMFAARETIDDENSTAAETSGGPASGAVPESVNGEQAAEEARISVPDLSEEDTAGDASNEFEVEQSEFREPLTSRMRRVFFSPFQKEE